MLRSLDYRNLLHISVTASLWNHMIQLGRKTIIQSYISQKSCTFKNRVLWNCKCIKSELKITQFPTIFMGKAH